MASDGFPVFARQQRSRRLRVRPRSLLTAAALVSALTLGGCAVEVVELQNTQPAREYAQQSALPGTIYVGWRVFQDKCTGCHGAAATGAAGAAGGPDLLPRVRAMGPRQFTSLVLQRYD